MAAVAGAGENPTLYDVVLNHDVANLQFFVGVALKRRLLWGVRTGKRSVTARARVEYPGDEDVARRLFPFLPPPARRQAKTAVTLRGRDALTRLTDALGAGCDRVERRTGEVFMVATVVHDQVPAREFEVEVGIRRCSVRYYEREGRPPNEQRLQVVVRYTSVYICEMCVCVCPCLPFAATFVYTWPYTLFAPPRYVHTGDKEGIGP
jgi:hypothetical protein